MATISFHVGSLLIGLLFGFLLGTLAWALAATHIMCDDQWSIGFGDGWKAGIRSEEKQEVESDES